MATLPQPEKTTATEIYRAVEQRADRAPRGHLGASQIGHPCTRHLWYVFRWCGDGGFSGRVLRLFRRGEDEEKTLVRDLMDAGITVIHVDPMTGEQFRVSACGGHFGGSMDSVGKGFPEPGGDKFHLIEYKTHNDKSFKDLVKKGVEKSKPEHYIQMQMYMLLSGNTDAERLQRAMYIAVNKNDDQIHAERIKYHGPTAKKYLERAERVIGAAEPLEKVSDDPSWYQCKMCAFSSLCHQKALPAVTCRSCCHATPEADGTWSCAMVAEGNESTLSISQQQTACPHHVYIPALVSFAEQIDASESENRVTYRMPDGRTFKNGDYGPGSYESRELRSLDLKLIGNEDVEALRLAFSGRVVEPAEGDDDGFPFNDDIPF